MKKSGRVSRPHLPTLNTHLTCPLCHGYFIDATGLEECHHSFCRSCIVKYLQRNTFCPVCDVQIHSKASNPCSTLKPDKILQSLVYKLVPGLYQKEMERRRKFYANRTVDEQCTEEGKGEITGVASFFGLDDSISLSLEYYDGHDPEDCDDVIYKKPKRYLQCPAAVTVRHLKKFLRLKFNIGADNHVDIIYDDECLPEQFSLIDVAYTFCWTRMSPMRFSYRILHKKIIRTILPAESKVNIPGHKTKSLTQSSQQQHYSLEQQKQSEYLGNLNLNPTNTSRRHRQQSTLDEEEPEKEKFLSELKIIQKKNLPQVLKEKQKHKKEKKKTNLENQIRKSIEKRRKDEKLKRRYEEISESDEEKEEPYKRSRSPEDDEEFGKLKNEALRKVFVNKPEVPIKRKDEEPKRKKRKKSKHHEDNERKKRKAEVISPTITIGKDLLKLKVKLTPLPEKIEKNNNINQETPKEGRKGKEVREETKEGPVEQLEQKRVEEKKDKEKEETKMDDETKKRESDSPNTQTNKERLLHLRAVRHKNIMNLTPPPSLTISKVENSETPKPSLIETRPSLEIVLVNGSKQDQKGEVEGVLDLSDKSTRSKEPEPKKTTHQSILQIAQNLVNRQLPQSSKSSDTSVTTAAMRNLKTLSDTAVNILMAAQSHTYSDKPENGLDIKIPVYPKDRNVIPPVPSLHELFPRGRGRPPLNKQIIKPGQNQGVRQIPNPSVVLNRQANMIQALNKIQNGGREENGEANKTKLIPQLHNLQTKMNNIYKGDEIDGPKKQPAQKTLFDRMKFNNNNNIGLGSSIRKIETMARSIESVAAGLTARAVSNAIDAK